MLGNAVLSLGEIHRQDSPATSQLWMPGALPGLCVCAELPPMACRGRTRWNCPHTLPLECTGGKSRNISKKRSTVHSTGSMVWTAEGPALLAALQKVAAVLLAPRLGDAGPVLTTAVRSQVKGGMFLYFCLPSQMSALTHPECGQQDHSLTVSARYVTPLLLGFHTLLLYSKNSEGFLLRQQSVQSTTRKPPSKSHPITKENSGCTKQVYAVNSIV